MEKASRKFDPILDDKHWNILFKTHFQHMQSLNAISSLWISGFSKMGMDQSKRPLAQSLTNSIKAYTGYRFIQTDQKIILKQIEWYKMISKFEMPLTCFVRKPEELAYCDEPDFWHDVMGHIPFLAEQHYSDMYQSLANTYIKAFESNNKTALKALDFIGGMIIELALIREEGNLKAFGSTLYSSSEVFEAFRKENQISFTKEALQGGASYDRHSFQGKYYIIDSLDQLNQIINSIRNRI